MPPPGRGLARGDTLASPETRQRVRDRDPHLRLVPVVLGGRPETSACSSSGEPTTSKPWRPRMYVRPHRSSGGGGGGGGWTTTAVKADGTATVPKRLAAVTTTRS